MVDNCQFHIWYPLFKDVTFKAKIYNLPADFKDYLNEDGVMMPSSYSKAQSNSSDDEDFSDGEDSDGVPKDPKYNFAELEAWIEEVVRSYDEKVFIKLNWSAPRDANWLVPNLHCSSKKEVFSLLKSSVFISHDISAAYEGCVDQDGQTGPEQLGR